MKGGVVVTGASGFIGGCLLDRLRAAERPVLALTRGRARPASDNIEWVSLDDLDSMSPRWPVAAVVHLAARAHLVDEAARTDEDAYRRANVDLSLRIADWAAGRGVPRVVFLSSIAVHGGYVGVPLSETSPVRPIDAYGRSKAEAEAALGARLAGGQTKLTILRPTVVFGPGNPGNLARLDRLVARRWPLPFARMRNRRSLTSVESLTAWIVSAVDDEGPDRTFVVADEPPVSTEDLVRIMARGRGFNPRLFYMPPALVRGAARMADLGLALVGRRGAAAYAVDRLWGSHVVDASAIHGLWGGGRSADERLVAAFRAAAA